jgi:hypothetical protein
VKLLVRSALALLVISAFAAPAQATEWTDYGPVSADVRLEPPCKSGYKVRFEIRNGVVYIDGRAANIGPDDVAIEESTYGHYEMKLVPGATQISRTWVPKKPKNEGCNDTIKLPKPLEAAAPPVQAGGEPAGEEPAGGRPTTAETGGGFPWVFVAIAAILIIAAYIVYRLTRSGVAIGDTKKETATYQPDVLLKFKSSADYTGDGVYSADGANQSIEGKVKVGNPAEVQVIVENDGTAEDTITLVGGFSNANRKVSYLVKEDGASALVQPVWKEARDETSATFSQTLRPGASFSVYLRVHAAARKRVKCTLTATSAKDGSKKDVAVAYVQPG